MSEWLPLSSVSSKVPDFTGEEEGFGLLSIITGLRSFRDGGDGWPLVVGAAGEDEDARRQARLFSSKTRDPRPKSVSGGMRRMWSRSVEDSTEG